MYDFKKQLEWLREQTELSGEDCWDIVCALRGPDPISAYTNVITGIKKCTTQVIRDWLSCQATSDVGTQDTMLWWIQRNRGEYTFSEVSEQCSYHFATHIYEAEEAIQKVDSEFYIFKKEENDDERGTDQIP